MARDPARHIIAVALAITSPAVYAQPALTLEQAASRSGRDLIPVHEGQAVTVQGQMAGAPVWALGTYYVPLRDESDHGLLMRGDGEQFSHLHPGEWIEVQGVIQSRGGLPLLAPTASRKIKDDAVPVPKDLVIAELSGPRYLGMVVRTKATITNIGEDLGGTVLEVSDQGYSIAAFFPRSPSSKLPPLPGANGKIAHLTRLGVGDVVRLTGLATQYAPEGPSDRSYQIMLGSAADVEVIESASRVPLFLFLGGLAVAGGLLTIEWIRRRRLGTQRRSLRAIHALSEDIIACRSPRDIAQKLVTVLPTVTRATSVRLYLFQARQRLLERVPTKSDPDPMAISIDSIPEGLANTLVICFKNRTLLSVPDVRRSPFVKSQMDDNPLRSTMVLPLFAQNDVVGVLEVGDKRHAGYFTPEEQVAAQHLANQVAASLKLQEQRRMREQLFRSEKLAATGQLISGVASELRAPLDSILQLATSLAAYSGRPAPDRELQKLASESMRASEIVSRLVSFAQPEDSGVRPVDLHHLIASLLQFRGPEWKTLGVRAQNRLAPAPALVVGSQGQLEQVFLNLLVHAEQYAAESAAKTIAISSTVIGRELTIEILYSAPVRDDGEDQADPFAEGRAGESGRMGLGVSLGIVRGHGGDIRFHADTGAPRFEVALPLAENIEEHPLAAARPSPAMLTLMLVDSDAAAQRQLLGLLTARGHRVVPAPLEEAADMAQRLRFDAVLWAIRAAGSRWSEFQDRIRANVPAFVLLSDGYDADLARSLEESGGFLLGRPIQERDLDEVLRKIEFRAPNGPPTATAR
jgi:signal transduction histidine kinase/CheY-like chemotaxis protein